MKPHLLHVFSTFAPGGPQVRSVRLIAGLGAAFRHSILALDGRTEARDLLGPEADVHVLPSPPRVGSLRTLGILRAALRALRPDLLLTYNWGAIEAVLASRLGGVGAVVHHEDGFRPDEVGRFKRRRVLARRLALPATSGVIVPSHTLHSIATRVWRLPPGIVHLIPNGVRLDDFPRADGNAALRATLGIPADAFVVGFVGHLRNEKNPVRMVQAFAAMRAPGAHLLMLGDGPERERVEQARQASGVSARVHLVGHRASPQEFYRAMDAFALSSDTEQMPVAELEAMASGLPVVGTEVGDVKAVLPPDQGPLVVPLSGAATTLGLAGALDALAADGELRARLGARNREVVRERFTFEAMLASYQRIYNQALTTGNRSRFTPLQR